nr:hypothetical protein [Methyloceanibacter marginalis]
MLAQAGNRVRANGFTNHLRLNVIVEQEMHLLVLGLLLRDVGLCGGQLLVQRFQLAGVEQVATCLLEAMLCAELLHVVLRLEETVAQCCKLPVHQGADLFRGRDLLVGLIGQVCLGNRLCQTGRLKGIDGGNGDIDDIGLIVARNLELLRKDQKGALIWIVVRRCGARWLEKACDARDHAGKEAGLSRAELRIRVEMLRPNHGSENRVRHDDLHLAVDQREIIAELRTESRRNNLRTQRVLFARVDQDLGRGRIERRGQEGVGRGDCHHDHGGDCDERKLASQYFNEPNQVQHGLVRPRRAQRGKAPLNQGTCGAWRHSCARVLNHR